MTNLSLAELDKWEAEEQAKVDKYRKVLEKKINENLIYAFNTPTMPANPLQSELIQGFTNFFYKIFTFTGANRIGKTTIGTVMALATMFGEYPWSHEKLFFPHGQPRKVRYIGQDWQKHVRMVVIPTLERWWPKIRRVYKKKDNQGVHAFWRDEQTGSTLELMSNQQEAELHEGWEGDLIVYDEPPKRDIRTANARGLIDRQGRELFCMTLLKEAWVDREIIKARNPDGSPDRTVYNITGDIFSNVGFGLTKEGVEQFEKFLTDDEKSARIHGKPSYLSGLVYPQFKRQIHLKKRFKIPTDWITDIAIDVHPRERQAILFVATSPKNERYIFYEIFDHGDGNWIGHEIVRVITRYALRIGRVIVDPLAKGDKNSPNTTFDKIDAVLASHGYYVDVASKDKQSGIIEVRNHLEGPNGEPSMWFFDDLRRTVFEIEGYMFDEDTQKPQDKDDHMMENLYRICLLDTHWYPLEEEDEDEMDYRQASTVNAITGY